MPQTTQIIFFSFCLPTHFALAPPLISSDNSNNNKMLEKLDFAGNYSICC